MCVPCITCINTVPHQSTTTVVLTYCITCYTVQCCLTVCVCMCVVMAMCACIVVQGTCVCVFSQLLIFVGLAFSGVLTGYWLVIDCLGYMEADLTYLGWFYWFIHLQMLVHALNVELYLLLYIVCTVLMGFKVFGDFFTIVIMLHLWNSCQNLNS